MDHHNFKEDEESVMIKGVKSTGDKDTVYKQSNGKTEDTPNATTPMGDNAESATSECGLDRVFPSVCLFMTFIVFGAISNILGPTLVHMGILFDANVAEMSLSFPCMSLGYIIGSVLTSFLFDRFDREIQIFVVCFIQGILLISSPWVPNVYCFYVIWTAMYICMGFYDSAAQPYTIRLWYGHRYKDTIVQALCGTSTIGLFLGPLVARPFVVELPEECTGNTTYNTSDCFVSVNNSTNTSEHLSKDTIPGIERVRYPYAILGVAMMIVPFSFVLAHCFLKRREKKDLDMDEQPKKSKHQVPVTYQTKCFKRTFLSLNGVFMFFSLFTVMIPTGLLSAFVIKGLKWDVGNGPLVMSVFAGAQAAGRIIALPTSTILNPSTMLFANVAITTLAYVMMLFVTSSSWYLMWICAALGGLGISTQFPSMLLWTSMYVKMTGPVGAMFFIVGSVGVMAGTSLAGFMFENYGHMWVAYLCLPAALMDVILLCVSFTFVTCYGKKRQQTGSQDGGTKEEKSEQLMLN